MPGMMFGQKPFGRALSRDILHVASPFSGKS
jgi:hypothetical protein